LHKALVLVLAGFGLHCAHRFVSAGIVTTTRRDTVPPIFGRCYDPELIYEDVTTEPGPTFRCRT
jgi:hypothetical protein